MLRILRNIYLAELIVLLFVLLSAALYFGLNVVPRDPWGLYKQRLFHSLVFYLVGISLCPFALRLRAIAGHRRGAGRIPWTDTLKDFQVRFLSRKMLVRDLRLIHAISVMFVVYINLKHLIPSISPAMWDPELYRWENSHFGNLIGVYMQQSMSIQAAPILSLGYVAFYSFVAVLIFTMVLSRRDVLACDFAAAFVLLWFLGILFVYLVPTLGPCFAYPELYSHLPFTEVTELQQRLLEHRQHLIDHANSKAVYLISGFPSLHLAVPILATFYLRQLHWILALVSGLFAVLTAITTLYFGWHYLLDDIGSIVLVFATFISLSFIRRLVPTIEGRTT